MTDHRPNNYGMLSARVRKRMVERLRQVGIYDPIVLEAMASVPRHYFVDEAIATHAYDDVSLPIGFGQTISQPQTVAHMTSLLLNGKKLNTVLEIGTGCGYQTAVLMASSVGTVFSIERIKPLLDIARINLRKVRMTQARLVYGDGYQGLPEVAPFDGIIVSASAEKVPMDLLPQLALGARLIMPIGKQDKQYLWCFEKTEDGIKQQRIERVKFVPLLPGKV